MTDEYRMFLESRRSEESAPPEVEHSEIPKWKPPEKNEAVIKTDMTEADKIEHYGIAGMKWHRRRFQYNNGTLTPEGRLRYLKNNGENGYDSDKVKNGSDKPERFHSNTLKYKRSAQSLTDEELDARNRRMQREAQYNSLRKQLQPKTKAERRKEIRNQILVATLTTAAAAIMTSIYKKAAVWMVKKATGGRVNLGKG